MSVRGAASIRAAIGVAAHIDGSQPVPRSVILRPPAQVFRTAPTTTLSMRALASVLGQYLSRQAIGLQKGLARLAVWGEQFERAALARAGVRAVLTFLGEIGIAASGDMVTRW